MSGYGAIYCEHANESPSSCPCEKGCYCYLEGNCGGSNRMKKSEMIRKIDHLIKQLPEEATWDDLIYSIGVIKAVERGIADAKAGRLISQKDVEAKFRKKKR